MTKALRRSSRKPDCATPALEREGQSESAAGVSAGKRGALNPRLLAACLRDELLGQLRQFAEDVKTARTALDEGRRFAVNAEQFLAIDPPKALTDAFETLGQLVLLGAWQK